MNNCDFDEWVGELVFDFDWSYDWPEFDFDFFDDWPVSILDNWPEFNFDLADFDFGPVSDFDWRLNVFGPAGVADTAID